MTTITTLTVADYNENYGGVSVIIDGRECSIASVKGYALYCKEDPVEAVADTLRKIKEQPYNGHKLVWINVSATMLTNSKAHYDRQEAKRAAMPVLNTGDVIEFEGNTYEIVPAANSNFNLKAVAA
jgi:hypothetical protein